jgi:hypothetical protein
MKRFLILFFLLSAFCLLMLSCASNWPKNFGNYTQDEEIKTMFEAHETVSEYNYFYTTYQGFTEAIVGIDKELNLVRASGWARTTDWQKIEPGSKKLKEIVEAMHNPTKYGFIIYGPGGDQVGVMYTGKWGTRYTPEIRLKNGNQLEVTPHKYNSTWAPS